MTYLLRRARAGCRGRAGRSASLPAAAAVVGWCARPNKARGVRRVARRSGGGDDWGAEQRASAAAGPTGKPGDAGGRVGVAFVGVCSAVVS